MQTNNKLREACEALMSEIGGYSADGLEFIWCRISGETIRKVRTALATPPRNCDKFNTGDPMKDAEDAYGAWQRYCDNQTIPPSCKVESAFKQWLFAPATEKEGGNDGNK